MSSYRVRNNSIQVTIYAATGYDTLALEYDIILFWLQYEVTEYDITVLQLQYNITEYDITAYRIRYSIQANSIQYIFSYDTITFLSSIPLHTQQTSNLWEQIKYCTEYIKFEKAYSLSQRPQVCWFIKREVNGHPTSIFGKYLFGRRFEIKNFRNICYKISCLPASPRIFEHLRNSIIHF